MKKSTHKIFILAGILMFVALSSWGQGGETVLVPKNVSGYDESTGNQNANFALLSRQKEAEVEKLVEMYHKIPANERPRLKEQIAIALNELFELNVKKREAEIKALEAEINDVERGLEFRKRNKKHIVEKRLQELLKE